jgi:hypothetical protein
MKHVLIARLTSLQEMLETNATGDWDENDPAEEFKAMAEIVKGYLPTQRDHMIDELGQLISDDDVEDALERLEAQSEIDGSVDAWDVVTIWEPFEHDGWTVDDLLGKL